MHDRQPAHLLLDVDRVERRMLVQILSEGSASVLAETLGLERGSVVRSSEEAVAAQVSRRLRQPGMTQRTGSEGTHTPLVHLDRREAGVVCDVLDRVEEELGTDVESVEDLGRLLRRAIFAGKAQRLCSKIETGLTGPSGSPSA